MARLNVNGIEALISPQEVHDLQQQIQALPAGESLELNLRVPGDANSHVWLRIPHGAAVMITS